MVKRLKHAIKGESGMPTTEAVALMAVALLMYAVFVLFKNRIQVFVNGLGETFNKWNSNGNSVSNG